ncbi:MAG TPA: hypothetical protein VLA97_14605 [Nocardioidaceae bacterium]|nr:hypothetical protein [Nocardioidaceae bacterium]
MAEAVATGVKRVYFHVGAPKTGTTYLQQVLFQNRKALAGNGVLYPYARFGDSFRSAVDFVGEGWGSKPARSFAGSWDEVATRAREWTGSTVIVSNELLGGASADRVAARLQELGPAEVHVVFTARDLARQLVSDWQEHVKHKHTVPLEQFVGDLVERGFDAPEPFGRMFWGLHDPVHVLGRWAPAVPPANVHVVTVPQPGAPADTLWRRFCAVTGLDPESYQTSVRRANRSMGVAETELLRRMNADLRSLRDDLYSTLVRVHLAERVLGGRSARLTLPPQYLPWVTERSREMVRDLADAGYRVEGDLAELLPVAEQHLDHVSPTDLSEADLAPAAVRAASGMVQHSARQRERLELLEAGRDPDSPRERARAALARGRAPVGRLLRRVGLRR